MSARPLRSKDAAASRSSTSSRDRAMAVDACRRPRRPRCGLRRARTPTSATSASAAARAAPRPRPWRIPPARMMRMAQVGPGAAAGGRCRASGAAWAATPAPSTAPTGSACGAWWSCCGRRRCRSTGWRAGGDLRGRPGPGEGDPAPWHAGRRVRQHPQRLGRGQRLAPRLDQQPAGQARRASTGGRAPRRSTSWAASRPCSP